MPIYDYVCSDCRHRVEVIHGINDTGPRFCPNCGHEGTMRKALATPAIHFKGSGWAKKDRSSTSGAKKSSGSSGSSSGDGASGDGASGDGKAASGSTSSDSTSSSSTSPSSAGSED